MSESSNNMKLADRLKRATQDLHKIAERTGVISDILRRRVSPKHYLLLLENLSPVYQTMEACISASVSTSPLSTLLTPEIYRYSSLYSDIDALSMHFSIDTPLTRLPITDAYCASIKTTFTDAPMAMLGHIYVRYLGDLNGGQVLQRLLAETLGISSSMLSFYQFPAIRNLVEFRQTFRHQLDSVELTEPARQHIIDTAMDAFNFNIDLSKAVKHYRFGDG